MKYKSLLIASVLLASCRESEVPKKIHDKKVHGYQQSLDKPPELSIAYPQSLDDLAKPTTLEIQEYTLKLPSILPVLETSGDGIYDIIQVRASRKLLGANAQEEFFRTEWEKSPNFQGNNIATEPLEIKLSQPHFKPGNSYEIILYSVDRKERKGEIRVIVHAK